MLTVGLIQHDCPPPPEGAPEGTLEGSKQRNVDLCCDMIREAASKGAKLIVTQELFASAYFCQREDEASFALAEPIPGPTSQRLCALAKELKVAISASLFERRAPGIYHNTSIMIDPAGAIVDRYRKMHIPDDPRFYEKYYFTPGDLGFRTQEIAGATTGMLVCWDQWFPEAARLTAMRGAQVLLYPTAIGWQPEQARKENEAMREAWRTIQRSHAIANGVFVCAVNRVGVEDDITFWGSSFIADPLGRVIAEGPRDKPAVLIGELDLSLIEQTRQGWPFLRDRRIDAYEGLNERLLDG